MLACDLFAVALANLVYFLYALNEDNMLILKQRTCSRFAKGCNNNVLMCCGYLQSTLCESYAAIVMAVPQKTAQLDKPGVVGKYVFCCISLVW